MVPENVNCELRLPSLKQTLTNYLLLTAASRIIIRSS